MLKLFFFILKKIKKKKKTFKELFSNIIIYMDVGLKPNENNNIKNLSYNMTSNIRIKNTKYLTTLGRIARGDAEAKVNEVINLYREGKISQIQTAENIIIDLIYNMKNKATKNNNKTI